jgi:MFS family permease
MKPHYRVFGIFLTFAFSIGALLSRLPDLQRRFDLTESELGLTILGLPIGALLALTLSSPLILRFGARTTAFVTVFGDAIMFAVIPFLPSARIVFAAFLLAGLFAGALEINVNLETDRHEAKLGYRVMNRAHGMWSLGFFVTALISAGVRQLGVSMQVHMVAALVVVVVAGVLVFGGIENAPVRAGGHAGAASRIAFPTAGLLPLCVIGASALLVEGAGVDWSGIYMRDVFAVEPLVGGLALSLFTLFMALSRLFIDSVVDRFGPRAVAATLLLISAAGVSLVAAAPQHHVALLGFLLMGVGCSAVYPLAISAAAQRTDRPSAVNVAALSQMTFIVFFIAPPLLGFVAERWGIRNSYLVCLPALLASLVLIRALSPASRAPDVTSATSVAASADRLGP